MSENHDVIWTPGEHELQHSQMAQLAREVGAADYDELWKWSVEDVGRFWQTMWRRYDVQGEGSTEVALADATMPGAQWFPDVRVNFAEQTFHDKPEEGVAIKAYSERGDGEVWTWARLREETARVRAGLVALGVGEGDRVAAYLPNVPETIAAFLATSSLGAVWTLCAPDFGSRTVIDRLAQTEPKVLLAVDSYQFNGKVFDRSATVTELQAGLPGLEHTVLLDRLDGGSSWNTAFPETDEPLTFNRVAFDHPLWVVYSSGTTGLPKGIVHGHGGVLLEQFKNWPMHHDTTAEDTVLWYSSTGWVMWNIVVGAMMTGCTIVIYDGSPAYPDMGVLFDVAEKAGVTIFGSGAALFHGCIKAGIEPTKGRDLSRIRLISSSASPLNPEAYYWVRDTFGAHVCLSSSSGGTDIAGAFVGGAPLLPVRVGELPGRMLGVAVEAWDDLGNPLVGEMGELVVTQPMPSMPVRLWNDADGSRYRDSYFDMFPGVWRHGDWISIDEDGSSVIYGRSDSTINRGGVRMGTAEIYAAVLSLPEVLDALVVDVPDGEGTGNGSVQLFITLAEGAALDEVQNTIKDVIRKDCSPRHVPDLIVVVPAIPRTLSNKVLEVPVKKLLMGWEPERAASRDSLANPDAFDWFVTYARQNAR